MVELSHDPGGKVRIPLQPGVIADAEFSVCGRYRHWLSRQWGKPEDPYVLWIGMNPSTADMFVDDPTIRKEIRWTRSWGFSSYCKVNVMDYRATDPKRLLERGTVPVSDDNFLTIRQCAASAARVVCAWGALPKPLCNFAKAVELMLGDKTLWCMGVTKGGQPRHPLYLKNATPPIVWRRPTDGRAA